MLIAHLMQTNLHAIQHTFIVKVQVAQWMEIALMATSAMVIQSAQGHFALFLQIAVQQAITNVMQLHEDANKFLAQLQMRQLSVLLMNFVILLLESANIANALKMQIAPIVIVLFATLISEDVSVLLAQLILIALVTGFVILMENAKKLALLIQIVEMIMLPVQMELVSLKIVPKTQIAQDDLPVVIQMASVDFGEEEEDITDLLYY